MRQLWARVRYLFRRERHVRDVAEEIDTHLHMEIEANIERGMSPDEARDVARRQFGSPARLRESSHEAWAFRWLESILQDIRYGLRQFRRAPGLFLAVVASLAIGLGANTAIFSLIDAAVLRPLPVAEPDQLIQLEWQNDGMPAGVDFLMRAPIQTEDGLQGAMVSEPFFRSFAVEQTAFASLIGVLGTTDDVAISTTPGAPAQQVERHYDRLSKKRIAREPRWPSSSVTASGRAAWAATRTRLAVPSGSTTSPRGLSALRLRVSSASIAGNGSTSISRWPPTASSSPMPLRCSETTGL
jgi:hypothetical protein